MGILFRKQRGLFIFTKIARLAFIGLIIGIASALVSTIWAVYIDSFVHSASIVGFISGFLTLVSFVSYFVLIPFIEKFNKAKLFSLTLIFFFIIYVLLAINTSFYLFIILAILATILLSVRITVFGIIVKDKSSKGKLSRNEGLIYTFFNVAYLIGPLIAGYVATELGINFVFVLSAIFLLISFFLFKFSNIKDSNIKKHPDKNLKKNFFDFFKCRARVIAYVLSGGVNFWWILIYVFMPLFIIRHELSDIWIGYFLFAVAFPLILFEFPFSKLAGRIGFRKIFIIGFLIPCVFALACFFITNVYFILGALVLASLGLAMLEPTTEAYFFDLLKGKQELRFYGPYNTTIDINQFLAEIFSASLLIFLPFRYIFLFFGLAMFVFFLISFKTKNIIEELGCGCESHRKKC